MTRAEQRRNRKLYERDFAAFCKIIRQYFPEFTQWLCETRRTALSPSTAHTIRL